MNRSSDRTYVAIIGDFVGSRQLKDREQAQGRLVSGLKSVNSEWRHEIEARFVVTLGDEFQGLLGRPSHAFEVVAALEQSLRGVRTRYGIGLGALKTPLLPDAIGMDGQAFHEARDAIERGKREDRWITVSGFGSERDRLLNGILRLMGGIRWEWTRVQAETVFAAREATERKTVARDRRVSEATVSKALKSALYEQFLEGEDLVTMLLSTSEDSSEDESTRRTRLS